MVLEAAMLSISGLLVHDFIASGSECSIDFVAVCVLTIVGPLTTTVCVIIFRSRWLSSRAHTQQTAQDTPDVEDGRDVSIGGARRSAYISGEAQAVANLLNTVAGGTFWRRTYKVTEEAARASDETPSR